MISFFANMFGYILNFIYLLIKNYGVAIIIFSILLKIALLPLSIKQQRTMVKSQKLQKELQKIQDKYKNNPEQMNKEIMDLYKRENMSPFSGCLSSIIQIILLFAMFYLVKEPLTYMNKIDNSVIDKYVSYIKEENLEDNVNDAYREIAVVKFANNFKTEKNKENSENLNQEDTEDIKKTNEEEINKMKIKMEFLGLDLSNIPKENYNEWTVFIIPVLYVLSSFVSINLSTKMTKEMKQKSDEEEKAKEDNPTEQMSKSMLWMMPIMSVSISLIAPLGLALYWLVNNILMIIERIIMNKMFSKEEK